MHPRMSIHNQLHLNGNNLEICLPFVMMALVCAGTLNCTRYVVIIGMIIEESRLHAKRLRRTSSAANFKTAVKGASSGTLNTLNGSFGSEVSTTLNVTFALFACVLQMQRSKKREISEHNEHSQVDSHVAISPVATCAPY